MELYTETSKSIQDLTSSPSNLFEIYTLNILISFGYYTIVILVPLYFNSQFGLTDSQAGIVFTCCGVCLGVSALLGSKLITLTGCKKGLSLATFSIFAGFVLLSMSQNLKFSLFAALGLVCSGIGTSWPLLGIAIKHYSELRNRSTSNSIMMMGNYLSGIIAGAYIDIVWNYFIDKNTIFEIIFTTAAGALGLSFCISLTLKSDDFSDSLLLNTSSLILNKKFFKFFCFILLVTLLHSICFEQLGC
jgi:MFS family permease